MNKMKAINELIRMRDGLETGDNFKGRAAIIKKINESIRLLNLYRYTGNIPALMLKERASELEAIRPN